MFEHAIAHLVSSGDFEVEGVHIAIVLSHYGAIKESQGDFFNQGYLFHDINRFIDMFCKPI